MPKAQGVSPDLRLPPPPDRYARFDSDFGQRVLLTVDTEEEFEWGGAFDAFDYGLDTLHTLERFQEFAEGLGVVPLYLVDWPVAESRRAQEVLGDAAARGRAEIGIQLHPWVNPPHVEETSEYNSFAGNLPADLEQEKFARLRDAIVANFDVNPIAYRAGRYGAGPNTARILQHHGVAIDSSVRARYDYSDVGGPDYSGVPSRPYWAADQLLELPLTTVFWGMLRHQGSWLYPLLRNMPRLRSLVARTGLLERISLTPEGVDKEAALRAIDMALDDRLPLLVLSFHSPSLAPGHTPYVTNETELDALYDWFRAVYAYLDRHGVKPTTTQEIVERVQV